MLDDMIRIGAQSAENGVISPELSSIVAHATRLRHELHAHPERTWHEKETAQRIRRELDRLGIEWTACAGTGTIADLGAGSERVALRADIDALPILERTAAPHASQVEGVMHACGHDGHTASLLATAAWLKRHESELCRPVRLIFQPAEEGGHGAKRMIEEGCLKGVTSIFGYHNQPTMPLGKFAAPAGPVMVSNGYFRINIRGRGGHASTPSDCRDPILAGAQLVNLAQQIVAQNVPPQQAAVITVTTFHGGTARNAIPDDVELEGTVRAAETSLRDQLAARLEEVMTGVCAAHRVSGEFLFVPNYQATVNHPEPAARLQAAFRAVLGDDTEEVRGVPFMGGEDFSYYLNEIPGAYALVGSGLSPDAPPLHSPRYDFNDSLIETMVRVWAEIVAGADSC
jgi:hippurate hydrolase